MLLGLMTAAANIIPLGLLHIRLCQFWVKSSGFHPLNHPSRVVRIMRHGLRALRLWKEPCFLNKSQALRGMLSSRASGLWGNLHLHWPINCLEMRIIFLKHFFPHLRGYHVLVCTDNTSVSHIGSLTRSPFPMRREEWLYL